MEGVTQQSHNISRKIKILHGDRVRIYVTVNLELKRLVSVASTSDEVKRQAQQVLTYL